MRVYKGESKLEIYEEEEFQVFLPHIFEIVKKEAIKKTITIEEFTFSSCLFEKGMFHVSYTQRENGTFILEIQVGEEGNVIAINSFMNES